MYAGNVYVWHLEKWFDVAALLTNFGLAEIGTYFPCLNFELNIAYKYYMFVVCLLLYLFLFGYKKFTQFHQKPLNRMRIRISFRKREGMSSVQLS